jgi:hypothetical protein
METHLPIAGFISAMAETGYSPGAFSFPRFAYARGTVTRLFPSR